MRVYKTYQARWYAVRIKKQCMMDCDRTSKSLLKKSDKIKMYNQLYIERDIELDKLEKVDEG